MIVRQRVAWLALGVTFGAPLVCAAQQPPVGSPIAIVNVNVVPMSDERVLARQAVVIEGGIITRLGVVGSVPIPPAAYTIDGAGKYLIPGLVDLHVHLASNPEGERRALLKLFVANGVTTVLNLRGTSSDFLFSGARDAFWRGVYGAVA